MEEEKEIKLEILDEFDENKIKITLEKTFNVNFEEEIITSDLYYDFEDNKFFLLNHAFRLRKTNDNYNLTYKALFKIPHRKENPWFILEENLKIPIKKEDFVNLLELINIDYSFLDMPSILDIEDLRFLIKKLNFKEKIKINKKRYKAKLKNYCVYLDIVENLGIFIEIEFNNSNISLEILKNIPFEYKRIYFGYTNLYASRVLGLKIPDFKTKYINNPDWNYIIGQKDIVEEILKNE